MTREEAIAKLDDLRDEVYNEDSDGYTYAKAIDMAIEALSAEPSGDLISRQEAIETLRGLFDMRKSRAKVIVECFGELLNSLPSADRPTEYNLETIADIVRQLGHLDGCVADMCDRPQVNSAEWVAEKEREFEELNRPKGEWIDREDSTDMFFLYRYECSVCGGKNVFNSSYCPNCGAHMR